MLSETRALEMGFRKKHLRIGQPYAGFIYGAEKVQIASDPH